MWETVIAVLGTLAGALLAGAMQQRQARAERAEARVQARRESLAAGVTALLVALADHRRVMWLREEARLTGAPADVVAAARADSHSTRAAVTAPQATVTLLAPELRPAIAEAVRATYALRAAADLTTLGLLRAEALDAADQLMEAAAATA